MLQRYKYILRVALDVKSLTAENEILEKNYKKAAGGKKWNNAFAWTLCINTFNICMQISKQMTAAVSFSNSYLWVVLSINPGMNLLRFW